MCEFQSLYFDDDGYVLRCKQCGQYQVGFGTTMLIFTYFEFQEFYKLLKYKFDNMGQPGSPHSKTVILRTPSHGVCIMLTQKEASRFFEILEEADNEAKALTLIRLFNSQA